MAEVPAAQFLLTAYPHERQRAHAVRWLGWLAYRMAGDRTLAWWVIPAWLPGAQLAVTRRVLASAVVLAASGLAYASDPRAAALPAVVTLLALWGRSKEALPGHPRPGLPRTVVPRRPRPKELIWLAFCLVLVWPFGAALLRTWTVPAAGPPGLTYRADRRSTALYSLSWMTGTAAVGLLGAALGQGYGRWLIAMVPLVLGAGLFFALYGGTYSLVKLSELLLLAQWRERVSFAGVLAGAAASGIVRETGPGYQFADPALQAWLAERHVAALAERAATRAAQAARSGARSALTGFLTKTRITRISVDFAIGLMAGIVALVLGYGQLHGGGWAAGLGLAMAAGVAGLLASLIVAGFLHGLVRAAGWTLANVPGLSHRKRLAVIVAAAVAAGVIVADAGSVLLRVVAALLPVAFVAACGGWACVLTLRKVRGARALPRRAPDAVAAAATGAAMLVVARHDLLTTQPAAGLLFPPAAWGSVRVWRAMNGSGRLTVRAAADIVVSLLLGAGLVLFLVWLANLLNLPRPEVAVLRGLLERAGAAADLPWWVWTGLYLALAGAAVAFAAWPSRLAKPMRWFGRLRVVVAAGVTRRALTGVHIGLMAIVLVGLAAPAALTPAFQRQLRTAYTVAVQRELEASGELAAYAQVRRQFTAATSNPVLTRMVADIHDASTPPAGEHDATSTEADLARRLGELQALVLVVKVPAALPAAERAAANKAGFDGPVRDESDFGSRLGTVDAQEKKDDAAAKRAEQAGDLAAAAIASTISIPQVSDNEVFQIVREYLGGLIEGSPLKDVFAAWAERLGGRTAPPAAGTMVVPDAGQLKQAAYDELVTEFGKEGLDNPFTDPLASDPAATRALGESSIDGAVDMLNQQRYLQENSGPCTGCTRPENPLEHPVEPPADHFVEP